MGGGGGGEGGVCRQNICYHVAAYLIPFNLICNMTMFWGEVCVCGGGGGGGKGGDSAGKIFATMLLHT